MSVYRHAPLVAIPEKPVLLSDKLSEMTNRFNLGKASPGPVTDAVRKSAAWNYLQIEQLALARARKGQDDLYYVVRWSRWKIGRILRGPAIPPDLAAVCGLVREMLAREGFNFHDPIENAHGVSTGMLIKWDSV